MKGQDRGDYYEERISMSKEETWLLWVLGIITGALLYFCLLLIITWMGK